MSFEGKSPQEALEKLLKKKEELEKEMEELIEKKNKGIISQEDFNKKKRDIEKKYIEVMDRIAQLKYIIGAWG